MLRRFLTFLLLIMTTISCSTVKEIAGDVSGVYAEKNDTSVVIVGMLSSRKFGRCVGADVDATTMQKILSKYSSNVVVLRDQQATKAAVVNALTAASKSDLMIFFYAGHGGSQKQSAATKANWIEPSGNDSYLCLYDAALLDDEIWNIVQNAKGRVVFIADCCHSGTMFRAPMDFGEQIELMSASPEARGHEVRLYYIGGTIDTSYSYGGSGGGLMTNSINRHFDSGRSYDEVFRRVKKDPSVAGSESVQIVEVGSSFSNYLVFR